MAFTTYCNHKGCRAEMAPVIDKVTLEVFCTECGEEINTVDPFMKRQLVSMGQTRRDERKKLAYSVACPSCKKEGQPKLGPNKELLCSYCAAPMTHLAAPFAELVRQNLKPANK